VTAVSPAAPGPTGQPPAAPGTVVLGMHRSGTSLVTGILHGLGGRVSRPDDLLSGIEHGTRTEYWESRSVVLFNESLLRTLGGDWAVPPDLPADWWTSPSLTELVPAARQHFWSVHPADGWLCKDPRLCLTLPFWRNWVLHDMRAVLTVRHPDQVTASLQHRDGLGRRHARWLWQRYMTSAVLACRDVPTLVISYDQLCSDPVRTGSLLHAWAFPDVTAAPRRVREAVARVRQAPVAHQPSKPAASALYKILDELHGSFLEEVAV
jgi:hypothetical protein